MSNEQQGEVVIMGSDGKTEHVFPSGFDPQQAAAIVRQQESGVPTVHASDMLSHRGIGVTSMDPAAEKSTGFLSNLVHTMEPQAHPTSLTDIAPLLIPDATAGAIAARNFGKTVTGRGLFGSALHPIESAQKIIGEFRQPLSAVDRTAAALQRGGGDIQIPASAATTPERDLYAVAKSQQPAALSDADFLASEVAAGRVDPSVAARIRPPTKFAPRPIVPKLQVDPASVPQTYRTSGSSALAPEPVAPPTSQPLGQPRVMTLKETPTSWTPEAARARIENSQWESGLEPGSAEAQAASGYHKYDAEMSSRLKFLMDNPNAALALGSGGALLREAILSRLRGGLANSAGSAGQQ